MEPRKLERRRPVPSRDMSVGQLSLLELRQELDRRIKLLQKQRDEHLEKAAEIEAQLKELGVEVPMPSRTPRRQRQAQREPRNGQRRGTPKATNEQPLVEVLASVLDGTAMTTKEAAERALEAGYRTNSRNFPNSVNVALNRDARFTRRDGKWVLVVA